MSDMKRQIIIDGECDLCNEIGTCVIYEWSGHQNKTYQTVKCLRCDDCSKKN